MLLQGFRPHEGRARTGCEHRSADHGLDDRRIRNTRLTVRTGNLYRKTGKHRRVEMTIECDIDGMIDRPHNLSEAPVRDACRSHHLHTGSMKCLTAFRKPRIGRMSEDRIDLRFPILHPSAGMTRYGAGDPAEIRVKAIECLRKCESDHKRGILRSRCRHPRPCGTRKSDHRRECGLDTGEAHLGARERTHYEMRG